MKRFRLEGEMERVNIANLLIMLSRGGGGGGEREESDHTTQSSPGRVFECKTCNRRFRSFQALGGHRASHKKPRLFRDQQGESPGAVLAKPRVHVCSICGLEFKIGQALGGHMRRHRATAESFVHGPVEKTPSDKRFLCLDLNLTPSENDMVYRKIGFGLEFVDKIPTVDCFH